MPPSLRATLLMTLGSALGAVAVLRLAHEADLAALCYGRDDAFLAGDSPAPTAPERSRWAVRARIQPWASGAATGWLANLAQAGIMLLGAAGVAGNGGKPAHTNAALGAALVVVVLAVCGDWPLLSGACDPGVSACGDAAHMLAANSCANPVAPGVFGDPGDAVPTGCVACDTTVANMAWTGLGFAGVGAGVLALLAAGNL